MNLEICIGFYSKFDSINIKKIWYSSVHGLSGSDVISTYNLMNVCQFLSSVIDFYKVSQKSMANVLHLLAVRVGHTWETSPLRFER